MLLRINYILLIFTFIVNSALTQSELQEGIRFFEKKEWEKAISFFKNQIERNSSTPLSYHYLGAAYLENKQPGEGYEILLKGVKQFPFEKTLIGNFINAGLLLKRNDEPLKRSLEYLKKFSDDNTIRELVSLIYLQKADDSYNKMKFREAVEFATFSRNHDNKNENAPLLLIYSYINLGKNKEAQTEAEKAVKLFPRSSKISLAYLAALVANNEYEKALSVALKLNGEFKNDIDFQLQLGMLYRANYKTTEASALFDNLISRFPSQEKVYEEAIRFYESVGMMDKVRELYETQIKVFKREKEFKQKIAETYELEKNSSKAREIYFALLEKKEEAEIRIQVVRSYLRDKIPDSASIHIRKILKYDNGNYDALKHLFEIYSEKNIHDSMISVAKTFVNFHGDLFYPNYCLAKAYFAAGDLSLSQTFAESALKIENDNPYPCEILADIFLARGENAEAEIMIIRSIKSAIKHSGEIDNKINIFMMGMNVGGTNKDNTEAEKLSVEAGLVRKLLQKNFGNLKRICTKEKMDETISLFLSEFPKNSLVLIQAGIYFKEINKLDSAASFFEKALNINPNIAEGHLGLAEISLKNGNYSEALKSYKRVISIDPANREAYDNLIKISFTNGTQNELAADWMQIYKTDKRNKILRERLIELLHKSDRIEDATKIIRETIE